MNWGNVRGRFWVFNQLIIKKNTLTNKKRPLALREVWPQQHQGA